MRSAQTNQRTLQNAPCGPLLLKYASVFSQAAGTSIPGVPPVAQSLPSCRCRHQPCKAMKPPHHQTGHGTSTGRRAGSSAAARRSGCSGTPAPDWSRRGARPGRQPHPMREAHAKQAGIRCQGGQSSGTHPRDADEEDARPPWPPGRSATGSGRLPSQPKWLNSGRPWPLPKSSTDSALLDASRQQAGPVKQHKLATDRREGSTTWRLRAAPAPFAA